MKFNQLPWAQTHACLTYMHWPKTCSICLCNLYGIHMKSLCNLCQDVAAVIAVMPTSQCLWIDNPVQSLYAWTAKDACMSLLIVSRQICYLFHVILRVANVFKCFKESRTLTETLVYQFVSSYLSIYPSIYLSYDGRFSAVPVVLCEDVTPMPLSFYIYWPSVWHQLWKVYMICKQNAPIKLV